MTHRGLCRLLRWQVADGRPGLRTLQFTATSFDVTFQEVLSTLATGGCLVVASEEVRRDPAALLDTIVEQRIQRLFLPYVALQLMAVTAQRRGGRCRTRWSTSSPPASASSSPRPSARCSPRSRTAGSTTTTGPPRRTW